jgi:hypothetical protein
MERTDPFCFETKLVHLDDMDDRWVHCLEYLLRVSQKNNPQKLLLVAA